MKNTVLPNHFFHNGFEYIVDYTIKNNKLWVSLQNVASPRDTPEFYDFVITNNKLQYYSSGKIERFYHNDDSIAPALIQFLCDEIDWKLVRDELAAQLASQ